MDKWQYRTLYIYLEELKDSRGKKYKGWVVKFSNGSRVEGIEAILDREGNSGWELVNMMTAFSEGTGSQWGGANTTGLRAFFKRKVQEATS